MAETGDFVAFVMEVFADESPSVFSFGSKGLRTKR